MEIKTASGIIIARKESSYGKFLCGYMTTQAWTGSYTIDTAWNLAQRIKAKGCSWYAIGVIVGTMYRNNLIKY